MKSTPSRADIVLSDTVNLRDLGGIAVRGGIVRRGVLLRADDVSVITANQAASLSADGLRTVIDLRSPAEAAFTGRGPLASHDIDHHPLPLLSDPTSPSTLLGRERTPDAVGAWYAQLVVEQAPAIVRGLAIVADAPGAVLFHCAAGKDRTGVFAACVLSVLRAAPADIAAEYALTDAVMPAILARLAPVMAAIFGALGGAGARDAVPGGALLAAPAATMGAMLIRLDAERGGLIGVLERAGLDRELVTRLEAKLVEPEASAA